MEVSKKLSADNFYPEFKPEREIELKIGLYEDTYFPAVPHRIFVSSKIKWAKDLVGRRLIICGDIVFFQVFRGDPFEFKVTLGKDRTLENYEAESIMPEDGLEVILQDLVLV
jgi:hypothetical protein